MVADCSTLFSGGLLFLWHCYVYLQNYITIKQGTVQNVAVNRLKPTTSSYQRLYLLYTFLRPFTKVLYQLFLFFCRWAIHKDGKNKKKRLEPLYKKGG